MTIKKPWKAEYWPMIIEEIRLENEKKKSNGTRLQPSWPYMYDYSRTMSQHLGLTSRNQYIYIDSCEKMEKILAMWDDLPESIKSTLRRNMKAYEKHLFKVIYNKRKEGFDALVAETNS